MKVSDFNQHPFRKYEPGSTKLFPDGSHIVIIKRVTAKQQGTRHQVLSDGIGVNGIFKLFGLSRNIFETVFPGAFQFPDLSGGRNGDLFGGMVPVKFFLISGVKLKRCKWINACDWKSYR